MRTQLSLLLMLATVSFADRAAEPSEAMDTPGATAPLQTPGDTTCRRFAPPGDKKIQKFCGDAAQWAAFDRRAVDTGVSCRWPGTPEALCLSVAQWESFDRRANLPQTQGSGSAVEPDASDAAPPTDEVIVSANRTLADLRKEIRLIQDLFLAKYNELNKVPEYTINCDDEAATGSRFREHVCRAKFVDNALRAEWVGQSIAPAALVMASKKEAFQKNMVDLASKSAELRELGQRRADLEERYNRVLRRALGSKE